MRTLLRYLCGLVVLVGILLIPTGSGEPADPAAPQAAVEQPAHRSEPIQAAEQAGVPAPAYGHVATAALATP